MGYAKDYIRRLRVQRVSTLAGLTVFAVIGNLTSPWLFQDVGPPPDDPMVFVSAFFSGALLAEGCLLGIWCALGTQAIKYRLPITCGLLVLGAWSFVVGIQQVDHRVPWQAAVVVVLSGLAFFCAIQVPLWILRAVRGLRIAGTEEKSEPGAESAQFGIRYLLGFTTAVAILLVFVKNSLPTESSRMRELPEIAFMIVTFCLFATAICLPALGCALSKRWRSTCLAWLGVIIFAGPPLVVVVLFGFLGGGPDFAEIIIVIGFQAFGTGATTLGVLWIMNLLGFGLVTRDR